MRIRDPFILPDQGAYYLYSQGVNFKKDDNADIGVEVYRSQGLVHWSEPLQVFARPKEVFLGQATDLSARSAQTWNKVISSPMRALQPL